MLNAVIVRQAIQHSTLKLLHIRKCLIECLNQVVDVLDTDAQSNGRRIDVLLLQLLWAQLRVGGCCWVDNQ